MVELFWVIIMYLMSELLIWGMSEALSGVRLEFLASVAGMVLVFFLIALVDVFWEGMEPLYHGYFKSKVDFINHHLGVGFPVPIVMVGRTEMLSGNAVGRVTGNFVCTNVLFWAIILALTWGVVAGGRRAPCTSRKLDENSTNRSSSSALDGAAGLAGNPSMPRRSRSNAIAYLDVSPVAKSSRPVSGATTNSGYWTSTETAAPTPSQPDQRPLVKSSPSCWILRANDLRTLYPVLLAFLSVFAIGIPISVLAKDGRVLDACVLWLTWIGSVQTQSGLKTCTLLVMPPGARRALATLLNPVLFTTLGLIGYTRAKASLSDPSLVEVLEEFSGGTPLEKIWSSKASGVPLGPGQSDWFGAGDAALSLLQCGIVAWGFKLYECRRQLWSLAGATVIVTSVVAAALSAFISVLLANAMGVGAAESLAFAARSTTLALAGPATELLGGNTAVNAAVVVCNGIVGQLLSPYLLEWLRVADEDEDEKKDGGKDEAKESEGRKHTGRDSATTVAAGTVIGINGVAMGVSYLCERRSRAAPYAALSMTAFGVMTTILTSVEPFRGVLVMLASK